MRRLPTRQILEKAWRSSRPVKCKTGLATTRSRMVAHRVLTMRSILVGDRIVYAAKWMCSAGFSGTSDAVIITDPEPFGGVCPRCEEAVAGPVVYRAFGKAGEVLYIGSTVNAARRFQEHQYGSAWWPAMDRLGIEQHPDIDTARRAEARAIYNERPIHNKVFYRDMRVRVTP